MSSNTPNRRISLRRKRILKDEKEEKPAKRSPSFEQIETVISDDEDDVLSTSTSIQNVRKEIFKRRSPKNAKKPQSPFSNDVSFQHLKLNTPSPARRSTEKPKQPQPQEKPIIRQNSAESNRSLLPQNQILSPEMSFTHSQLLSTQDCEVIWDCNSPGYSREELKRRHKRNEKSGGHSPSPVPLKNMNPFHCSRPTGSAASVGIGFGSEELKKLDSLISKEIMKTEEESDENLLLRVLNTSQPFNANKSSVFASENHDELTTDINHSTNEKMPQQHKVTADIEKVIPKDVDACFANNNSNSFATNTQVFTTNVGTTFKSPKLGTPRFSRISRNTNAENIIEKPNISSNELESMFLDDDFGKDFASPDIRTDSTIPLLSTPPKKCASKSSEPNVQNKSEINTLKNQNQKTNFVSEFDSKNFNKYLADEFDDPFMEFNLPLDGESSKKSSFCIKNEKPTASSENKPSSINSSPIVGKARSPIWAKPIPNLPCNAASPKPAGIVGIKKAKRATFCLQTQSLPSKKEEHKSTLNSNVISAGVKHDSNAGPANKLPQTSNIEQNNVKPSKSSEMENLAAPTNSGTKKVPSSASDDLDDGFFMELNDDLASFFSDNDLMADPKNNLKQHQPSNPSSTNTPSYNSKISKAFEPIPKEDVIFNASSRNFKAFFPHQNTDKKITTETDSKNVDRESDGHFATSTDDSGTSLIKSSFYSPKYASKVAKNLSGINVKQTSVSSTKFEPKRSLNLIGISKQSSAPPAKPPTHDLTFDDDDFFLQDEITERVISAESDRKTKPSVASKNPSFSDDDNDDFLKGDIMESIIMAETQYYSQNPKKENHKIAASDFKKPPTNTTNQKLDIQNCQNLSNNWNKNSNPSFNKKLSDKPTQLISKSNTAPVPPKSSSTNATKRDISAAASASFPRTKSLSSIEAKPTTNKVVNPRPQQYSQINQTKPSSIQDVQGAQKVPFSLAAFEKTVAKSIPEKNTNVKKYNQPITNTNRNITSNSTRPNLATKPTTVIKYSQEEIARKREEAIRRKQSKMAKYNPVC